MAAGVALFAAALLLHAAAAFGGAGGKSKEAGGRPGRRAAAWRQAEVWRLVARWRDGGRVWVPTLRAWLAALALVHGLGVFSFFYLLSEGTPFSQLWCCGGGPAAASAHGHG